MIHEEAGSKKGWPFSETKPDLAAAGKQSVTNDPVEQELVDEQLSKDKRASEAVDAKLLSDD